MGTHRLGGGERRRDDSLATPGGSPMTGDGAVMEKVLHNASQVQAHIGKGESNQIENANDLYQTDRRSMARNHGWLPPSVDASRRCFLSVTVDEEPGSRANEARDAIMPMFTC